MNQDSQKAPREFSIVIPALNLRTSLGLILRCLEAQTYPASKFECIIVDDGSTDGTREFLESYSQTSFHLSFISNTIPRGRGEARNQGWRRSEAAIVVFLDGDTLPTPQWLSDYARAFAAGEHDVISGGRYCIDANPRQEDLYQHLASLARTTPEHLFRVTAELQFDYLHRDAAPSVYRAPAFQKFELELQQVCLQWPRSILCAYSFVGGNIAVKKSFLEETQGFDQFLRRAEDTDLGIRLLEAGARFGFADGANAYHQTAVGEINRGLNAAESVAFFYRHPYRVVLLIYLWFLYQFNQTGESAHPAFQNLLTLAQEENRAASLDIKQEFHKLQLPPIPTECSYTREDFVNAYVARVGNTHSVVSTHLDSALAQGLYTEQRQDQPLFDYGLTCNWLRYRTPLYEHELQNSSYHWRHRDTVLRRSNHLPPLTLSCEGRYELIVDRSVVDDPQVAAVLNIPLPIETESQRVFRFTDCFPPDLLSYAESNRHMIPRYIWPRDLGEVRFSYLFECEIKERLSTCGNARANEAEPAAAYLRPMLPPNEYPKAKMMLKKIMAELPRDVHALPERIYHWLLDNISYYEPLPVGMSILDTGFGMESGYTRLFVNLCRLAAIPAREQCGALFSLKTANNGDEKIEMLANGANLFNHCWAEFYLRGEGWIPVDFSARRYGRRSLTSRNVHNVELRNTIMAETELHDAYYFGNLDPYRIQASSKAVESPVSLEFSPRDSSQALGMQKSIRQSLQVTIKRGEDLIHQEQEKHLSLKTQLEPATKIR
jgi:glycosyltransferase involved in cell wall biosynthesis